MNHTYFKSLILAIVSSFLCFLPYSLSGLSFTFSDIVLLLGFSEFQIDKIYIIYFITWYFPLLLFQIFWGTYIYRHFCSASVYYFSRCDNRVRWFFKEAASLYAYVILYLSIMVLSGTLLFLCFGGVAFNAGSILLLGYYLLLHSLWLFTVTLLTNIAAIKFGSSGGFITMASIQLFFLTAYVPLERFLDFSERESLHLKTLVLKCNPISHLVLVWHSSKQKALDELINRFEIDFSFRESIALFLILTILSVILGCRIVKKHQIISINQETGGVS